ncbi:hypothetical protein CY35_07G087900 [Sphagnum magellanicum]|uniref:Uncharacterized protein n=1 Tax=Sphagnum magellanicum TaxID=128215 RepID=A0ACB8HP53_9BRYO|nr:hypothetical protein CY35_07G087900 [Sphagnum magellanicum]
MKWWQPCDKESMTLQSQHGLLPHGFDTWRKAFISKYSHGKQKILSEEIMHAVNKSWIHVRRIPDRFSKHVKDCVPGNTMRKLMERLSLTFHVCINRDQPVRLKGKANVVYFPASCLLRYPTKASSRGVITLESLNSVKVMATSNKLLRTVTVASFTGQNWEMVSKAGASPGPLCLVQHCSSSGASLMVGTLFEGVYSTEISSSSEHSQEQVLLVMVSLHLSDLIWKMLELGESPTSQLGHQIFPSDDPIYGLHGWHVSIQLHTFRRLCWTQDFHQVFWSSQDSIAGEKAVFLLISSMKHESFPGVLNSPWKAEVFSGELRGVFMLDFTLWDEGSEIAWHCTRAVCTEAATLATVEYGPPGMDGERMHMAVHDEKQGISISMNLCIPFTDLWNSSTHQDPSVVITDLHFALSSVFLHTWFGRSTI